MNRPVAGARVDVYEVVDVGMLCQQIVPEDPVCEARAPLRATAVSDDTGFLRLVLPRP